MSPGLTTTNDLKAAHPIFLGDFKGKLKGVIKSDTLYLNDKLYKIKPQMLVEKIKPKENERYKNVLEDYKIINKYVFENDKLLLTTDTTYFNRKFEYLLFE